MTNKFQYKTGDLYFINDHITIVLRLIDTCDNNFKATIFHFNQTFKVHNPAWYIYQSDMKIND